VEVSKRFGYPVEVPLATYARMVRELWSRDSHADAEAIGRKMLERDPKNTQTLSQLARVAGMQKDDSRAIGHLTQALKNLSGQYRSAGRTGRLQSGCRYRRAKSTGVRADLGILREEYRYQDDRIKITYENGKIASTGPAGRCELRSVTQTKFYCVGVDLEFNFQKGKGAA
jgi:hypothetical protein